MDEKIKRSLEVSEQLQKYLTEFKIPACKRLDYEWLHKFFKISYVGSHNEEILETRKLIVEMCEIMKIEI